MLNVIVRILYLKKREEWCSISYELPMAYKPLENRQLTAVNRPVNWALNRSGYRS
jgi:hypothetical protein